MDAQKAQNQYGMDTSGANRNILGALTPENEQQIQRILFSANEFDISLYTISTGKNWGYGTSLPVVDDCIILDLRRMNKILEFNEELSCVTLQPGVTQQDLYNYMLSKNLKFMVPTTGAGPDCSLIGNALERGYGITPYEDHFSAILQIKAILPNGEYYYSQLYQHGGTRSDQIFKWKIGPFIDGLFAQSNFGIVTEATLALAQKPENVTQFIAFVSEDNFEDAIHFIGEIKKTFGNILGGVNIMNKRRVLAMVDAKENWSLNNTTPEMRIYQRMKDKRLADWVILGGIYGPEQLTSVAEKLIRKKIKKFSNKSLFLSRKKFNFIKKYLSWIPYSELQIALQNAGQALDILEGVPSKVALPLAYLKNKKNFDPQKPIEIEKDNCGLIWFSPLLPLEPTLVRDFAFEVIKLAYYYGIDPLITLTTISERCFDSTIPIIYDKDSAEAQQNAKKFFKSLIELSKTFGVFPYRLDIDTLRQNYQDGPASIYEKLKKSIDPKSILAPGRYQRKD